LNLNTIYNGDASEILKIFPDECIDLVITSPPYDALRVYDESTGFKHTQFPFEEIAKELTRVLKPGGVIVWVVGDATIDGSETLTAFQQAIYFRFVCKLNCNDTMIYQKNSSQYPGKKDGVRFSNMFEYMFIFSKGKPKTVNLLCDKPNRWAGWVGFGQVTQRGVDGKLTAYNKKPTPDFSIRGNIWKYNTGKNYTSKDPIASKHPALFPDLLAFDHIRVWSNKGDVVLDPMAGSGTSLVMAKILGRQYIGIELSPEYCNIINERLTFPYDVKKMEEESSKLYASTLFQQDSRKKETKEKILSIKESKHTIKLF
jgi:DNA modification methylase